jgi:Ni/Co efflux regulator RcnB
MKKLITLSLVLVSTLFTATFASAQRYNPQQDRYDQNRRDDRWNDRRDDRNRRNNRGVRVTTQTRIVRQGFRTFRETVQIKYFPNGKVTTKVLSRTRIR